MTAKVPGFHFASSTDGAVAIEMDQPYQGAVTITWRPTKDFPGSDVEFVVPQDVFGRVVRSYVAEIARVKT